MKNPDDISFLGRGWGFPPTFTKGSRLVEMIQDEEDIRSSLEILLSTRIGERIMQPNYGCNLEHLVFENLDTSLKTYIVDLVRTAILYFEPRIEVENITLESAAEAEGVIMISIDYRVRSTNSRQNYVYPYYQQEGSNL